MSDELYDEWFKKYLLQLEKKWALGWKDRGLGHGDWAVIIEDAVETAEHLVVECKTKELAEHIINLHNQSLNKTTVQLYPAASEDDPRSEICHECFYGYPVKPRDITDDAGPTAALCTINHFFEIGTTCEKYKILKEEKKLFIQTYEG